MLNTCCSSAYYFCSDLAMIIDDDSNICIYIESLSVFVQVLPDGERRNWKWYLCISAGKSGADVIGRLV